MKNVKYADDINLDLPQVLALYESVGWSNYTRDPGRLERALAGSLKVIAARAEGRLIGLIRAVGDGQTILYIQDILVLPEHQGRGIGKRLIEAMDAAYPDVYQKVLLTDNQPRTVAFYKRCGFTPADQMGCLAFLKMKG